MTDSIDPTDPTAVAGTARPGDRSGRAARTALAIAIPIALLAGAVAFLAVTLMAPSEPEELAIVVPAGTWERIERGEDVELMPVEVELSVGDSIRLRNDDERTHTVGPFVVRPDEEVYYTFGEPAIIEGACTINPDETIRITIS